MEVSAAKKPLKGEFHTISFKIFTAVILAFFALTAFFGVRLYVEKRYIYPIVYGEEIISCADKYGLSRATVFAMVKAESGFNARAVSSKGAKGLMQLTSSTADYMAEKLGVENYDVFDVETNLEFGCCYIKYLINKFACLDTALVAYNAGEGRVSEWLSDERYSKDGKTLKTVPYKESAEYLQKIYKTSLKYKKLYGDIVDKR